MLITFEGPEGSGKTYHSKELASFLSAHNYSVVWTSEPGGTSIGQGIRSLLFTYENTLEAWTEALLFLADRAQHVAEQIKPHLMQGDIVICDRFVDSTLAYQGYGRGLDLGILKLLNKIVTQGIRPDLTFLLDIDVEIELSRRNRGNSFDGRPLTFHRRVREGYLLLAQHEPERWVVIPTDGPKEEVQKKIQEVVLQRLSNLLTIKTNK